VAGLFRIENKEMHTKKEEVAIKTSIAAENINTGGVGL